MSKLFIDMVKKIVAECPQDPVTSTKDTMDYFYKKKLTSSSVSRRRRTTTTS